VATCGLYEVALAGCSNQATSVAEPTSTVTTLGVEAGEIRFHRGRRFHGEDWVIDVYLRGEGVTVLNGGTARVESGDPIGFVVWYPSRQTSRGTFWAEYEGNERECWYVNVPIKCIER